MIRSIGVVGGGAWGTALAVVAARAGRDSAIWARDPAVLAGIANARENARHLPGIKLDPIPRPVADLAEIAHAEALILAIPAQSIRQAAGALRPYLRPGQPVIIAAKGLERGTAKRLTEVLDEVAPDVEPAVLSGPSFAADVVRGLPTAVTVAARSETLALSLCAALGGPSFRPYAETDMVGVEIGGALKNVLAIAVGIVAGRGIGASARAALIARGFAELRRFAADFGARPETLMGLSGLGDLVLTASGPQSRNFAFGQAVGEGRRPGRDGPLAEGVATAPVAAAIARNRAIDMPIVSAVAAILDEALSVGEAVEMLMSRPLKREAD